MHNLFTLAKLDLAMTWLKMYRDRGRSRVRDHLLAFVSSLAYTYPQHLIVVLHGSIRDLAVGRTLGNYSAQDPAMMVFMDECEYLTHQRSARAKPPRPLSYKSSTRATHHMDRKI